MSWAKKNSGINVGDRVCFKAGFLRSTGQYTGDAPFLRGTVVSIKPLGGMTVAKVDWHDGEEPKTVALQNLSKVTARGIADE